MLCELRRKLFIFRQQESARMVADLGSCVRTKRSFKFVSQPNRGMFSPPLVGRETFAQACKLSTHYRILNPAQYSDIQFPQFTFLFSDWTMTFFVIFLGEKVTAKVYHLQKITPKSCLIIVFFLTYLRVSTLVFNRQESSFL